MRAIEGITHYISSTPLERLCNDLHDAMIQEGHFVAIQPQGIVSSQDGISPYALLVPKREMQRMFESEDIRFSLSQYAQENMREVKAVFKQCQALI